MRWRPGVRGAPRDALRGGERQDGRDGAPPLALSPDHTSPAHLLTTPVPTAVHASQVRDAFYLLACTVLNQRLEEDPANVLNASDGGARASTTDLRRSAAKKKDGCAC